MNAALMLTSHRATTIPNSAMQAVVFGMKDDCTSAYHAGSQPAVAPIALHHNATLHAPEELDPVVRQRRLHLPRHTVEHAMRLQSGFQNGHGFSSANSAFSDIPKEMATMRTST